ncbi:MAG: sodium/solute symporter [Microscillaceae bacterium]|nr:sodium/solute symporter [Microscillaceae bacterium]
MGGSLIASNISAEQMIGMTGPGYAVGLAISSYELMAAATLLVVAKYFLPIFLKNDISTMPQFLEKRFDGRVRTGLAIFWLLIFVFVNITSLLYLGGLALENMLGIPLVWGVIGLAVYSSTFSIFGGLRAVVWTDVVQVIVLVFGGTVASVMILQAVGNGDGIFAGLQTLYEKAPEKFDLIFSRDATYTDIQTGETKSAYAELPGISVLIGGMWIANLYYWGTNQYIIQRALAAKSLQEAQKGLILAAFVKILLPFIIVLPGIAAFVLGAEITKADEAYPWVINNYVSVGFKGIVLAALVAAIGSSLSSMVNSTATIYTLDIHQKLFDRKASEMKLVYIGQVVAAVSLVLGIVSTPLLSNFGQIFQFVQEYTGFVSPGILVVFIFGLFWERTSTQAALVAVFLALPLSLYLKIFHESIPFINRMGICFVILSVILVIVSLMAKENKHKTQQVETSPELFKTSTAFNLMSVLILGILAAIYTIFW